MQVLSLRHSRPAKSGYDESCGITPYASRKAQKMPKQGKTKGEVKPNARSKILLLLRVDIKIDGRYLLSHLCPFPKRVHER